MYRQALWEHGKGTLGSKGVFPDLLKLCHVGSVHFPRAKRNSKGIFNFAQECKNSVLLTKEKGEVNHLKKSPT